jgi:hypothetical protein
LSHVFTVTNDGSSPVTLKVLNLGCNCLAADCPDSVAPHSSAPLRVDLDIRNRERRLVPRTRRCQR